ncbi:hypothetical protein [Mycobacterium sp. Z3061]|uniref:hypothetical protein n=1 Tax=Mycobacterium sp. Z3061 TaxID=3073562 RepID=UPI00287302FE|nr:hypothetical protein [Mycobacterium sp. Z3061]
MSCGTREDWAEALGALGGSVSRLLELTAETLSWPELLTTLGGSLGQALADRLRPNTWTSDGPAPTACITRRNIWKPATTTDSCR